MTVEIAPATIFVFALIFTRLGAMLMLLPAIGEATIPARARIALAFGMTMVLYPLIRDRFPPMPEGLAMVVTLAIGELLIGLFVGGIARVVMSTMQFVGGIVAFQIGLAFAQNFDPTQGQQTALLGSFLSVLAVTLVFAFDLHHLMIRAMRDSYELFQPGRMIPVGDAVQLAVDTVATSFRVSLQLAAPFLVFGLVFYAGLGVLSKLMPQVQVFFVAMPANIGIGLVLLMLLLGTMALWFADYFVDATSVFVR
jgi:flagellar biosynthetic protein FliR